MIVPFPLAPRYRLDDASPWLEGIDPARHYWIRVNGEESLTVAIPGLQATSIADFKAALMQFRALQAGDTMTLARAAGGCTIHCISPNCYGIAVEASPASVWHLFDQETLESLLMTSHLDWKCAPRDVDLGRRLLAQSWAYSVA